MVEEGLPKGAESEVQKMEEFLDEATKKEHDGFRQRMQHSKAFMTGALIVLVIVAVILAVVLPDQAPVNVDLVTSGHQDFMLSAPLAQYASYQGSDVNPQGTVTLIFDNDDYFLVDLQMSGLETYCEECKMRVHSAKSCDEQPGAALWDHALHPHRNPWDKVHYTASEGEAHTAVTILTGHGPHNLLHRVFVVYDKEGNHMACGKLEKDTTPRPAVSLYASIGNLPVYTDDSIQGAVSVQHFEDNTFLFSLHVSGLPANCKHCRVGIQEGTDCGNIGSHFFDHIEMEKDPWATARGAYYSSGEKGRAMRSFFLYNGFDHDTTKGHAVLFHAEDGTRIGCGILDTKKIDIATAAVIS